MDRLWVGYSQPFEHLQHIFSYGQILRRQAPSGIESFPWQWLWNDVQIPYIKVEQQVKVGDEIRENRPIVLFLGAMNPFVLALWPFALAFVAPDPRKLALQLAAEPGAVRRKRGLLLRRPQRGARRRHGNLGR